MKPAQSLTAGDPNFIFLSILIFDKTETMSRLDITTNTQGLFVNFDIDVGIDVGNSAGNGSGTRRV